MAHKHENKRHKEIDRSLKKPKEGTEGDKKFGTDTDADTDTEINPSKLEKESWDLDREGSTNTKGHQPYEY